MNRRWIAAVLMCGVTAFAMADDIDGRLAWGKRAELGTPLSGRIDKVEVELGDRVGAGDLLVALSDRHYRMQLTAAKAQLEAARQDKSEADTELERTLDLFDRTVLSEHDLILAKIGAARANANWLQAKATQAKADNDLRESRVLAPFKGVVVALSAVPGEVTVNRDRAESLVTVVDDSHFLAQGVVTLDQVGRLEPGDEVEVAVRGTWHSGSVDFIGLEPVTSGSDLGYPVSVIMKGSGEWVLRSGEPVVIRFK